MQITIVDSQNDANKVISRKVYSQGGSEECLTWPDVLNTFFEMLTDLGYVFSADKEDLIEAVWQKNNEKK